MKMQSRAQHNLLTSNTLEGLVEVRTKIVEVFDAHGKAQEAVREAIARRDSRGTEACVMDAG